MSPPTERDKMVAGHPYDPADPNLVADRLRARTLCQEFNALPPEAAARAAAILGELMNAHGSVTITAPFRCGYGYNIQAGENTHMNYDCVILDIAPVVIGKNVLSGPGVHLYGATHPMSATERLPSLLDAVNLACLAR